MMASELPDSCLYVGRTVHVRFQPFEHRLAYGLYQLLVDVDTIGQTTRTLRWLSYNRFGLLAFYDKDHGDRSGNRLRPWVEGCFQSAGIDLGGGGIRLLTFPRVLGFVFNPVSFYFGYYPDGRLAGMIYEVNNTFGDTHCYVAPAENGAVEHHEADKVLHVSPFFDVSGRYAFTVRPPDAHVSIVIEKFSGAIRDHLATLKGRHLALTDKALRTAFFAIPLLTLQVVAAIHWEALKLVFKGARYHHRPLPPQPTSTARMIRTTHAHD